MPENIIDNIFTENFDLMRDVLREKIDELFGELKTQYIEWQEDTVWYQKQLKLLQETLRLANKALIYIANLNEGSEESHCAKECIKQIGLDSENLYQMVRDYVEKNTCEQ